ncbi:predicted protein [Lichtheimia corymbifera JMRC:FSU:9682]|uniref:Uncharacterized protein n=1 Tax=Lichtheimia corymbifera JMRC:FSU:9682 TaxID=1263082 RepID=A0A068SCJ3_9FUNG|nr:predicted protein [Lichtheimia corymbifera JMRC:FSU:9682]
MKPYLFVIIAAMLVTLNVVGAIHTHCLDLDKDECEEMNEEFGCQWYEFRVDDESKYKSELLFRHVHLEN